MADGLVGYAANGADNPPYIEEVVRGARVPVN